jgi:cobalt-zinc-cadmium efflux system outer membrane protein
LSADDAVQIAMLNNRDLQAIYTELGVAQADLVQAGLFRNPILDAAVQFPLSGIRPDIQLSVVIGFLDAFYVPLRKRVAAAQFEEAKLRVTGAVLDFALLVRTAFYGQQANEQMLELRGTIVQALTASLQVSRRLHEAGNITDLDLARDRALMEASKLALRSAEVAVVQGREQLNSFMGAWGEETEWDIDGRLPEIPEQVLPASRIERTALTRSLDLSNAQQRIMVAGQQLGYDRATALIPSVDFGASAEREPVEGWRVGPAPVPIPSSSGASAGRPRRWRSCGALSRSTTRWHADPRDRPGGQERMRGAKDRRCTTRHSAPVESGSSTKPNFKHVQIVSSNAARARAAIETSVAYVGALREYWLALRPGRISSGRAPAPMDPGGGAGARRDEGGSE